MERLRRELRDRNKAAVARALGWHEVRVAQMIGRGQVPNAIDAARLCEYLETTVEAVFLGRGERPSVTAERGQQQSAAARLPRRWRAYRLDVGPYRPESSIHLAGDAEVLEPEDVRERAGLVPILAPVAAGRPREAHDQDYSVGAAEAWVRFDVADPSAFALRVDGDSMSPDFMHGDIVICAPGAGRKRPPYRDGMLAVIIYRSERVCTFKLLEFAPAVARSRDQIAYLAKPINRAHSVLRLAVDDIQAVYPVIGWVRRESTR